MINPNLYDEVKILDEIVKYGEGDIEIRKDPVDYSPIVFSKKLNHGFHLEMMTEIFPLATIAQDINSVIQDMAEAEENYNSLLEKVKNI